MAVRLSSMPSILYPTSRCASSGCSAIRRKTSGTRLRQSESCGPTMSAQFCSWAHWRSGSSNAAAESWSASALLRATAGAPRTTVYGSAKARVTAFLSGLRNRLAGIGVHVVTVKPGFVRTRMTDGMNLPAGLTAEPEEVAAAVVKAIHRRRYVVYVPRVWRLVMLVLGAVPERFFKRINALGISPSVSVQRKPKKKCR